MLVMQNSRLHDARVADKCIQDDPVRIDFEERVRMRHSDPAAVEEHGDSVQDLEPGPVAVAADDEVDTIAGEALQELVTLKR